MASSAVAPATALQSGGRLCVFCHNSIEHLKRSAKYCSVLCRNLSKQKSRPFIGLDGEGIGNRYILLAAKRDGKKSSYIYQRDGLDTKSCLDFLLNLPKGDSHGEKPIYVWFAFDYDVNMILGDLPLKGEEHSIEELRRLNHTFWEGYKITYIPRKILKVRKDGRYFHSTDIFSFYQTSFEKALQDWEIPNPEIITRGKAARQDFSHWNDDDIVAYNNAELDAISILAEKLRAAAKPLDLAVRSWHGPGALAGSWLSKHKVERYKGEVAPELYEVATRAYFGGRIDAAGYGFVEPVYHYDVVSAYPSAIRFLPDCSKLTWIRTEGNDLPSAGVTFVGRIRWRIPPTRWGPFPWRNRQGSIRFPREGEGWYWHSEIRAAVERFGAEHFELLETWSTLEQPTYPLQTLVEEAFAYRHELKQQGSPAHKAVKLVLNSLYGKFAQTVGRAKYYSPIWAGLITSHTRAQLQRAITDDVVCVMTDSLWSRTPLQLDASGNLGGWEAQDETRLILAEAGLYEATSPDGSRFLWQRGFDKRTPVDIPGIVTRWLDTDPLYEGSYSVHRFIGMGLASMTSYPWREWVSMERKISPVPFVGTTKRLPLYPLDSETEPEREFQPLSLRPADEQVCSYPYAKLTQEPELIRLRLSDETEEVAGWR